MHELALIEVLHNNIQKLEEKFSSDLRQKSSVDILQNMRLKIDKLKKHLAALELQLLNELPYKKKWFQL